MAAASTEQGTTASSIARSRTTSPKPARTLAELGEAFFAKGGGINDELVDLYRRHDQWQPGDRRILQHLRRSWQGLRRRARRGQLDSHECHHYWQQRQEEPACSPGRQMAVTRKEAGSTLKAATSF